MKHAKFLELRKAAAVVKSNITQNKPKSTKSVTKRRKKSKAGNRKRGYEERLQNETETHPRSDIFDGIESCGKKSCDAMLKMIKDSFAGLNTDCCSMKYQLINSVLTLSDEDDDNNEELHGEQAMIQIEHSKI